MTAPRKPKPFGSFPAAPRHESFNAPPAESRDFVDPAPGGGLRQDHFVAPQDLIARQDHFVAPQDLIARQDHFVAPDEIAVLVDEVAGASAGRADLVSPQTPHPTETFVKERADVTVDPLKGGIADLQRLTLDAIKIAVEAQMDFVAALRRARTPSEAIAAHNACARRQYEAAAARWLDLAGVAQRLAAAGLGPFAAKSTAGSTQGSELGLMID